MTTTTSVNGSFLVSKCMTHTIEIMQFMEGKEHLFALGKVFLCCMFLGGP